MQATLLISILTLGSAAPTSWRSHGELMNRIQLAQPALLSDEAIDKHNNDKTQTWTAGRNTLFEGATLQDAKVLMGTLQNTDVTSYLPHQPTEAVLDVPDEFDWRTDPRAANCPSVKEIRDQANCGSCWAFGSVEAMTDRICIASNASKNIHLSAEDVTSCDHLGDMGCNGGIPSTVYTYYRTFGIVDGGNYGDKSMCYSYQLEPCAHHSTSKKYANCTGEVKTPSCARKCENGKNWEASKHRGAGGYSVCQQGNGACADAMEQEIYQNGPITGMFFVHQSFLSYKSGVYSSKLVDPMLGGHAIKIMGYGTDNGVDYWLVANSWNSDWGDNGFFKIKRGVNMDNIENPVINGGPVAGKPKLSEDLPALVI
jgi:cathepsin B